MHTTFAARQGSGPVRPRVLIGRRYRLELQDPTRAEALAHLRRIAKNRQLTLLTATRQTEISEATVLAALLQDQQS